MSNRSTTLLMIALVASLPAGVGAGSSQGKGEGAIVTDDNTPIYADSQGDRKVAICARGDVVAGAASVFAREFYFSDKDGRVQVAFFANAEHKGMLHFGWMDPSRLSKFSYDCSCGGDKGCVPTRVRGLRLGSHEWNTCFQEAWDAHAAALKQSGGAAPSSGAQRETSGETKSIEVGQTIQHVETILGAPKKKLTAGSKVIYVYSDVKVTFVDGKVVDVQ